MEKHVTLINPIKKIVQRGAPGPASTTADPSFDSITMNTAASVPATPVQGQSWWDDDEKTISFKQNGTTLQIGQEQQWNVRNTSGATIANGTPVMATGSIGASGRITVSPMDGTTPTNAKLLLGIATEEILNNADGKVSTFGKIRGIQTNGGQYTETWVDGDLIYISPSTAGDLTNVTPTSGQLMMPVAFVVNSHATVGTLAVRVTPIDERLLNDMLAIGGQAWDVAALGAVTTALTMDASLYSEFTATLPLTGTTTTISISNLPTEKNGWPVLHLITGATFDAPTWTGIDATDITLVASTTHNIGFQPVKTTSGWIVVATLMTSRDDA